MIFGNRIKFLGRLRRGSGRAAAVSKISGTIIHVLMQRSRPETVLKYYIRNFFCNSICPKDTSGKPEFPPEYRRHAASFRHPPRYFDLFCTWHALCFFTRDRSVTDFEDVGGNKWNGQRRLQYVKRL
jgi:hypothetical protein